MQHMDGAQYKVHPKVSAVAHNVPRHALKQRALSNTSRSSSGVLIMSAFALYKAVRCIYRTPTCSLKPILAPVAELLPLADIPLKIEAQLLHLGKAVLAQSPMDVSGVVH